MERILQKFLQVLLLLILILFDHFWLNDYKVCFYFFIFFSLAHICEKYSNYQANNNQQTTVVTNFDHSHNNSMYIVPTRILSLTTYDIWVVLSIYIVIP